MFYHKNLSPERTKKVSILVVAIIMVFSLNFNSFLFLPHTLADETWDVVTTDTTVTETPAPDTTTTENPAPTTDTGAAAVTPTTDTGTNSATQDTWTSIETPAPTTDTWATTINIDDGVSTNTGTQETGSTDTSVVSSWTDTTNTGNDTTGTTDPIDSGYFDTAFDKGSSNNKIFDLQNILAKLGLFSGQINGTYDNTTIDGVYQYQLNNNLISANDSASLKWFFGPKTRAAFNVEYVKYKQALLDGIGQIIPNQGSIGGFNADKYAEFMDKFKQYFFANKYSFENIFGSWVFVGNNDIDFSLLSGKIMLPLVFQSSNTLQGNIAEVDLDQGTVLKTASGELFTWNLASPELLDPSVASEIKGQDIVSVLDVWGNTEKITLEDASWVQTTSTIKMPAPGLNEWDTVVVNYSHDGVNRYNMWLQKVFLENGEPFVQFETTHFTMFSIGLPVGTFTINSGAASTYATWVTLNSYFSWATNMRFGNTTWALSGASWVAYNTGYAWTISGVNGFQTVYAQFSGYYGIQSVQASILFDDTVTWANLKVKLDGWINGTTVLDSTTNANNFSWVWSLWNVYMTGNNGVVLSFDGTSKYAERTGIAIAAYPFTMSTWVRSDSVTASGTLMVMGNSALTNTYFGLILSGWYFSIVGSNTTLYAGTSPQQILTGQWYHVVWVFSSATSRILYVNWIQIASNLSSITYSGTNSRIRVGRQLSTLTSYFSGYMDDVRIYNKSLSLAEINNIYTSRVGPSPAAQYLNDGSFRINNDDIDTFSTWVTLNSDASGATQMRFGNTTGALSSASWVAYNTGYSRYLDPATGMKTVYAEFSGVYWTRSGQDSIFLDTWSDTNLKLLIAGNITWTTALDSSTNIYNMSGVWAFTSSQIWWLKSIWFSASTQYLERTGVNITAYPFSMSSWVNLTVTWGTQTIMTMGNSQSTGVYRALQLVNGAVSMVASNTTAVLKTSPATLTTNRWYHIVWVFNSATDRRLFVNGTFDTTVGTTTSVTYSATNSWVRIGRQLSGTTNNLYGYVHDTRIYNKALSTWEIYNMYAARSTTDWMASIPTATIAYSTTAQTNGSVVATLTWFSENGIVITNNSGSNTYTFTKNGDFTFFFKDWSGNVGSTIAVVNWITPSWSMSLSWPTNLSFGSALVSWFTQQWEKAFTGASDYFQVSDTIWADAWYYTTLAFSNLQYGGYSIPNTNIYVKTSWSVTTLGWTANARVTTAIWTTYVAWSSPLTFIQRTAWTNSSVTGTYWVQATLRVDIPSLQMPGTYTGTIIYTLY